MSIAVLVGVAWGAASDVDVGAYLEHDWYYAEIVLFHHRTRVEGEQYMRFDPLRYPLRLQAFEGDASKRLEPLDATVLDCLELPALDLFDGIAPALPGWMIAHEEPLELSSDEVEMIATGNEPPGVSQVPVERRLKTEADLPPIEVLPEADIATPEEVARDAFREFETELTRQSLRWLAASTSGGFTLADDVARMRRSSAYDVVHHGRWLQAVPARDREMPLLIQLGERLPNGRFGVEGTLSVTLGRYLHVGAELWVHAPPPLFGPFIGDLLDYEPDGYARLSERRRMRSAETHYLDHPEIGLVVRIEPLEVPQALIDLVRAVEESEQELR